MENTVLASQIAAAMGQSEEERIAEAIKNSLGAKTDQKEIVLEIFLDDYLDSLCEDDEVFQTDRETLMKGGVIKSWQEKYPTTDLFTADTWADVVESNYFKNEAELLEYLGLNDDDYHDIDMHDFPNETKIVWVV